METVIEEKYQEAVSCLKENVEVLSQQQEFLLGLKKLEFQHRKKERLMELRLEEQRKALQKQLEQFQEELQTVSKRTKDKEEKLQKSLDELQKKTSNPNYSFWVKEDIYARFQFPWEAVEPGARVLLYGGGIVGKIFLEQLAKSSYCNVVAICDKNPSKTGIQELPVITLRELARMDASSYDMILIAIEKKNIAMEIKGEMDLAGIPTSKVRWFDPAKK